MMIFEQKLIFLLKIIIGLINTTIENFLDWLYVKNLFGSTWTWSWRKWSMNFLSLWIIFLSRTRELRFCGNLRWSDSFHHSKEFAEFKEAPNVHAINCKSVGNSHNYNRYRRINELKTVMQENRKDFFFHATNLNSYK